MSRRRQTSRASSIQPEQAAPAPSTQGRANRGRSRTPAGMSSDLPSASSAMPTPAAHANPPSPNPLDAPSSISGVAAASNITSTENRAIMTTHPRYTLFNPFASRQQHQPASFTSSFAPSTIPAPGAYDIPRDTRPAYDPDEDDDDDYNFVRGKKRDNGKGQETEDKQGMTDTTGPQLSLLPGTSTTNPFMAATSALEGAAAGASQSFYSGAGGSQGSRASQTGRGSQGSRASQTGRRSQVPGAATQIWRRGMGILRDVDEDDEGEADDEDGDRDRSRNVKRRRIHGSRRREEGSSRTPTQASVSASAPLAPAAHTIPDANTTGPQLSVNLPAAPAHTRTNTVGTSAPGPSQGRTNTTGISALSGVESAVSQFPGIPGLPGSFEGLSGIGGQNELGVSQFEESLPALQYNSHRAQAIPMEDYGVGLSFNPALDLADPIESQIQEQLHSDIIYNRSGNPLTRTSGEPLRPEDDDILGPLLRTAQSFSMAPAAQPPIASTSSAAGDNIHQSGSGSQSLSLPSTSGSRRRKRRRFGDYDPTDDLVSFGDPPNWEESRTRDPGETTGPKLILATPEELEMRAQGKKKRLFEDDIEGNLEFGEAARSQGVLDRHVRPMKKKTRPRPHTTGPSLGDNVGNPILMDDPHSPMLSSHTPPGSPPSPSWQEMYEASQTYIKNFVIPDRRHRASAAAAQGLMTEPSDGEEEADQLQGGIEREESLQVTLAQQPRPDPLIFDETTDEEEGGLGPGVGGNVLAPNSSQGSAVADDSIGVPPNAAAELDANPSVSVSASGPASLEKPDEKSGGKLGGWRENLDDEEALEYDMEVLFPRHEVEELPPPLETPIGRSLAAAAKRRSAAKGKGREAQSSGESLARRFPPNQQGAFKRQESSGFWTSSADPSQASKRSLLGPTQFTLARTQSSRDLMAHQPEHERPSHVSRYPQPDGLSISTDNSVMRSQLFSSKLAAYNAYQAGLQPGDEEYSEPPEENYQRWVKANPESDIGSASTAPAEKGKVLASPFAGAVVRMPGSRFGMAPDAENASQAGETPQASGSSLEIIPDSQEVPSARPYDFEPMPAAQKPPRRSMKTTDPRRRRPMESPDVIANSFVGTSSGTTHSSQPSHTSSGRDRLAWQSSFASKPYAATSGISIGMLKRPAEPAVRSETPSDGPIPAVLPPPVVEASLDRSSAEAQIEAELIPETQYSQRTSVASPPVFSPPVRHESDLLQAPEQPTRQPIVLVLGTASASELSSGIVSRQPSALQEWIPTPSMHVPEPALDEEYAAIVAKIGGQNGSSSAYGVSRRIQEEESFGLSGIGGQNDFPVETADNPEITKISEPISSFELADPASVAAAAPSSPKPSPKRKRVEDDAETGQDEDPKPVSKKARKVPPVPAPLPPVSEPIRRTRSFSKPQETPASHRGPMTVPQPPPRPSTVNRAHKPSAAPRTPPARARRATALLTINESSSPLSSPPPTPRQETASPTKLPKSYLKGRTLVADSSSSTVAAVEAPGTSNEHVDAQTSASQDPFKTLAKSASVTKLPTRGASLRTRSQTIDPIATKKKRTAPAKNTGKRTREDTPDHDLLSVTGDISPPPSKKQRGEPSSSKFSKTRTTAVKSKPKKPRAYRADPSTLHVSTAEPYVSTKVPSTAYCACRDGGRVFAPWNGMLYPAIVSDHWVVEDEDGDVLTCQIDFDDGSKAQLPLHTLYRCELQAGDELRVPGKRGKKLVRIGHVSAVPSWEDRGKVSVRVQTEPVEEVLVMDAKEIAIPAAAVKTEWSGRKASSLEDIGLGRELILAKEGHNRKLAEITKARGRAPPTKEFLSGPRWKDSPPPPPKYSDKLPPRGLKRPPQAMENRSTSPSPKRRRLLSPPPTATSAQDPLGADRQKPFSGFTFILALALSDDKGKKIDRDALKTELADEIVSLGGTVVDGFDHLVTWGGQVSDDGDRWVWDAADMHYGVHGAEKRTGKGKRRAGTAGEPDTLFLIADGVNRHAKYMMALAAGIPCVDRGWIDDKGVLPWTSYLLPAGQCQVLGHTCSQWVDKTYTDIPRTLGALLQEPGNIAKALDDKSMLFVYPSRIGSEIEEDQFSHVYVYPALACLMGSSRVEVVHDFKAASRKLTEFDAIVHEGDTELPETLQRAIGTAHDSGVICAGFSWVSDCLITGSYLRLRDSS